MLGVLLPACVNIGSAVRLLSPETENRQPRKYSSRDEDACEITVANTVPQMRTLVRSLLQFQSLLDAQDGGHGRLSPL